MNEQPLFHRACALGVLCMLALVAFGQAAGHERLRMPPLEVQGIPLPVARSSALGGRTP